MPEDDGKKIQTGLSLHLVQYETLRRLAYEEKRPQVAILDQAVEEYAARQSTNEEGE